MDILDKINRMRIQVKRKFRYFIIIGILASTLASGYMLYNSHQLTETEEVEYTKFQFKHDANIDYTVHLLDNPFFEDETAESGLAYIVSLTDFIEVNFVHRYAASGNADFDAEYSINSYLTAYRTGRDPETREETRTKIWQTSEVILPLELHTENRNEFTRTKTFRVDYNKYLEFVQLVAEELGFSPSLVELRIDYIVNIEGKAQGEEISSELVPELRIAITDGLFDIGGNLSSGIEDSIMGNTTKPNESTFRSRRLYDIITKILFALLLLTIIVTRTLKLTTLQKTLNLIMKKHGDRIVFIKEESTLTSDKTTLEMTDFLDLVKIADEIAQPIFYEVINEKNHLFYVLENNLMYTLRIIEEDVEEDEEKIKEKNEAEEQSEGIKVEMKD
ncbi:MAG: DUF5305 family protein [Alkaliphilus sp.]